MQPGDAASFSDLVRPHRAELVVHAYRMTGSLADAEDCVQDALTRAWTNAYRYEERGLFRAWLYRIVTNRCLTVLKHSSRRELPTGLGNDEAWEFTWIEPLPESWLSSAADDDPQSRLVTRESVRLAFVTALQRLPARQRAVLLLREVLGFSAAETADLIDTTVPAVNSLLQRARNQVRVPARRHETEDAAVRQTAQRYLEAWEGRDVEAIVSMLCEDARFSMPPLRELYVGPGAIRDFLLSGPLGHSAPDWRFLPTRANGQLAFGTYQYDTNAQAYLPAGLDVISFGPGGRIDSVVAFLQADLTRFGLPGHLPAENRARPKR